MPVLKLAGHGRLHLMYALYSAPMASLVFVVELAAYVDQDQFASRPQRTVLTMVASSADPKGAVIPLLEVEPLVVMA